MYCAYDKITGWMSPYSEKSVDEAQEVADLYNNEQKCTGGHGFAEVFEIAEDRFGTLITLDHNRENVRPLFGDVSVSFY